MASSPPSPFSLFSGEHSAELVSRIVAGDPGAEAELLDRFGRVVTHWLDGSFDGSNALDDLYQETFRLAIEKIRRRELREPRALVGFLRALARNLSVQHFRNATLDRRRHEPLSPESPLPAGGEGPLAGLLAREAASRARGVLAGLPNERDRQILTRFYLLEENKEQICRELGLGSEHFKRVLHRARERFRAHWERGDQPSAPSRLAVSPPAAGTAPQEPPLSSRHPTSGAKTARRLG